MKGIALSRVFVLIVAALLIMTAGNAADPGFDREPAETFAAGDIVSDTFHSVPWRITSDVELIIGTDGTATKFTELDQTGENPYYFPWNGEEYREKIKSVRFAGTVSTEDWACLSYMFYCLSNCISIDLSNFKVDKIAALNGMFASCSSLKTLDLSHFDLSGVSDTANVFDGCGIEILYTPVDLRSGVSIALPYVMHDDQGRQYMSLPPAK